jgi:hypothetical protein
MKIVDLIELEKMRNQICDTKLMLTAALKRADAACDIFDRWLQLLEFRTRYAKGEENERKS